MQKSHDIWALKRSSMMVKTGTANSKPKTSDKSGMPNKKGVTDKNDLESSLPDASMSTKTGETPVAVLIFKTNRTNKTSVTNPVAMGNTAAKNFKRSASTIKTMTVKIVSKTKAT